MFRKPTDPLPAPPAPRSHEPRARDVVSSGFFDSSRELAGGLEVTDGTVSALPEDLKAALAQLRQGKGSGQR